MIQIAASTDEPFFSCNSLSILAVTITVVECLVCGYLSLIFELMDDIRILTHSKHCKWFIAQHKIYICIYMYANFAARSSMLGLLKPTPIISQIRSVSDCTIWLLYKYLPCCMHQSPMLYWAPKRCQIVCTSACLAEALYIWNITASSLCHFLIHLFTIYRMLLSELGA